jgi:acyl-CoA synthetase (AMP-forming)/AMP-acid ligase II
MAAARVPNIADPLILHARQRPTQIAIIQGDQTVDYRMLDRQVSERAARLQDLGVRPGQAVGLALRDSIEHLVMLYAVARAGAVILPMDWRWLPFEKQRLTDHFQPALVVVEPGESFEGTRCVEVDDHWHAALQQVDAEREFPDGDRGLIMSLSSGTTGRPKGPMLTHGQMVFRFYMHWGELGFGSRERYINATPLYFGGGRSFCMSSLYSGASVVLFAPPYTPEQLAAEVARTQSTVSFLVPTLLRRLLQANHTRLAPMRQLKTLISSGSALTAQERQQIRELICPQFLEYYSSTEGGGVTTLSPSDQMRHGESVGRPVFCVEVCIVDEAHQPVPYSTVGRIRYRGPAVAESFHGDPEASQEAFRDGWFYPGDLGAMNEDGYLFLKGRVKDMIIRGGINIYPQEIEATLLGHPAVAEAAVVGWPSREFDEEVAAFVMRKGEVADADLLALCKSSLAPYKVPRQIFFLDEFPRNSLGKVLKAELARTLQPL